MSNAKAQAHILSMQLAHGLLLKALGLPATPAQLTHTFAPSKTHILWTLGHLAWCYEAVSAPALGLKPELPARFGELFGFDTKPTPNAADYPSLAEITAVANKGFERVVARVGALTDAELAAPMPPDHPLAKPFPNIEAFLAIGSFHTGYHLGQITLLRTSQGLSPILGG